MKSKVIIMAPRRDHRSIRDPQSPKTPNRAKQQGYKGVRSRSWPKIIPLKMWWKPHQSRTRSRPLLEAYQIGTFLKGKQLRHFQLLNLMETSWSRQIRITSLTKSHWKPLLGYRELLRWNQNFHRPKKSHHKLLTKKLLRFRRKVFSVDFLSLRRKLTRRRLKSSVSSLQLLLWSKEMVHRQRELTIQIRSNLWSQGRRFHHLLQVMKLVNHLHTASQKFLNFNWQTIKRR